MVRGSPGGTLLRIIDLQLEGHQSQDHLLIAQGDNLDKGIVTTLFGNVADLTSSVIALPNASTFIVHFHSNYHGQAKRGWLLTFQPLSSSQQTSPSLHGHKIKSHYGSAEEALDGDLDSPRRMLTSGQPLPAANMAPGAPSRLSYPAGYASPASSSAFSLRGVGTFSTVPLMELDVQPFHPQQDWQGDLKECLGSLLPRSILRAQRKPVLTTTVLEWRKDDVVRVMITTSEGADDLVLQLKNALSTGGRVRCNDSLEMYLPDILRDVHSSISGQNWLLASVCIIAFFLIIFSAVLFVHCKQRRVIVRKLRSSVICSEKGQLDTVTTDKSPSSPSLSSTVSGTISSTLRCTQVLSVAMEPAIQRNPLYDLPPAKQAVWDNKDTLKDIVNGNMLTRKCRKTPSPTGSSNVVFRQATEETIDLMEVLRMYPQRLSRAKSGMGGTVINQEIPSLTKGYDVDQVGRSVTMGHSRLVEEDETESSTRSVGSPTSFDCQLEAETGETLEVCQEVVGNSEESLAIAAAITQLNEWRNGKPMTVRAVKQKNLLKKQIRQEIFEDLHFQKAPEDRRLSA
ncbi:hypothetical protein RvY_17085-2 [Ramazzottius varieornatus]|uniref:Uncharacterized protein n=1 Tax=Ramazzottius varieornatus TaxID=947166 RepID=A0A1D1W0X1_RAMVA|nr:hypothetical protein RvY_17085-2 [Ramazzottius varieornatus]